jgi:hypothetical protein
MGESRRNFLKNLGALSALSGWSQRLLQSGFAGTMMSMLCEKARAHTLPAPRMKQTRPLLLVSSRANDQSSPTMDVTNDYGWQQWRNNSSVTTQTNHGFWRMAEGGGTRVGVNFDGSVHYSTDGVNWNVATTPFVGTFSGVDYMAGTFVVISWNDNRCLSSPDGITWTTRTMPANRPWYDIANNGTHFVVAVRGQNRVARSADGITWTQHSILNNNNWTYVMWTGSLFVVQCTYSPQRRINTSPDGVTWTRRYMPVMAPWSRPAYLGTTLLSMAYDTAAISTDNAVSWTQTTLPMSSTSWVSVSFNGYFLAFNGSRQALRSTDGINWTTFTLPVEGCDVKDTVEYGGVLYLISNGSPHTVSTSDGLNWTVQNNYLPTRTSPFSFASADHNGSHFLMAGYESNVLKRSVNGVDWSDVTLPEYGSWLNIHWNGQRYMLAPNSGDRVLTSTDGQNWTAQDLPGNVDFAQVHYFNNTWLVFSSANPTYYYSTNNGTTWNSGTLPGSYAFYTTSPGPNRFVIPVYDYSSQTIELLSTTDGINWVVNNDVLGSNLATYIAYGNGRYVMTAYTGANMAYSSDGLSWTTIPTPSASGYQLKFVNGRFIFVDYDSSSGSNVFHTSTDGITWTPGTTQSTETWLDIV